MTDKKYLEMMSNYDDMIDHDDNCGQCEYQKIMAQVARDLLAEGNLSIAEWHGQVRERWEKTKYYKLWVEAHAAKIDPAGAFKEKGWEM